MLSSELLLLSKPVKPPAALERACLLQACRILGKERMDQPVMLVSNILALARCVVLSTLMDERAIEPDLRETSSEQGRLLVVVELRG